MDSELVADKPSAHSNRRRGINQNAVRRAQYLLLILLVVGSIPNVTNAARNARHRTCHRNIDGCCYNRFSRILSCANRGLLEFPRVESTIASTIEQFHVSRNNISEILAGSFEGYDNLEELLVDHNKLKYLESGTFLGVPNLKELHIHWNIMFAVQSGAFSGLMKLEKLFLDNNAIEYLPDGAFSDMPMLTHLMLQSNKLHDRSFPRGLLKNLTSLKVLNMSKNHLSALQNDFFQGLNRLQRVYLVDNLLVTVDMQQWPSVENRLSVDLRHNPLVRIINVPEKVVHLRASLHYLQCTCENERALSLILSAVHQGYESYCANFTCISYTDSSTYPTVSVV